MHDVVNVTWTGWPSKVREMLGEISQWLQSGGHPVNYQVTFLHIHLIPYMPVHHHFHHPSQWSPRFFAPDSKPTIIITNSVLMAVFQIWAGRPSSHLIKTPDTNSKPNHFHYRLLELFTVPILLMLISFFMVALCNRETIYIFMLWFVLLLFFPRLISAAADWMSTILRHMVWS